MLHLAEGSNDSGIISETYVTVAAEVLQQLDFSQGALGQDLLAEHVGNLLDGDAITRDIIVCGTRSEGLVSIFLLII